MDTDLDPRAPNLCPKVSSEVGGLVIVVLNDFTMMGDDLGIFLMPKTCFCILMLLKH